MLDRFKHTADMGEITGLGGEYEEACQQMLNNGVLFLEQHSGEDLTILDQVSAPLVENLEGLEDAMSLGVEDEDGIASHMVLSRLKWINEHGWLAYCKLQKTGLAARSN